MRRVVLAIVLGLLLASGALAADAEGPPPIVFTLRFPAPESHLAEVEAVVPAEGKNAVELMMAVWSPGYYKREDYATRIRGLTARTPEGTRLVVEATAPNHWRIETQGAATVVVTYRLVCKEKSVTLNWVSPKLGVLNGAATFITLDEAGDRPHKVHLELPASWPRAMTALEPAPDGKTHHYRAADFATLVDSPILAGDLAVHEFEVEGSVHQLVHGGDLTGWPPELEKRAVRDLETMVQGTHAFWGFLPFRRYVFLNVHREGGGGLEHMNSTLVTVRPSQLESPRGYPAWLGLTAHEYFHAFNVKRLRPVELGPFDYERPPETDGLWIAEGLTTYFAELILVRSGLRSQEEHLAALGRRIGRLQSTPGRLVQTLEESSRAVWKTSRSGLAENPETTVSYYLKGPVVGFLLDAEIQKASHETRNLGDVLRLAYERYGGDRGFTAAEFRAGVHEVAGADLGPFLDRALASTEELDYEPALAWYGLALVGPAEEKALVEAEDGEEDAAWKLERLPQPSADQARRIGAWLKAAP